MGSLQPARAVVLFDIDGTLVRGAGPQHGDALIEAVRRSLGVSPRIDHIPVQGMLDSDILEHLVRNAGVSTKHAGAQMARMWREAQRIYRRERVDLRGKVCPGALALLRRLDRTGIPAGLVSGNLPFIAWEKMRRAGLRPYLRFGAFAGSARTRAGLAGMAIRHARGRGWIGPKTRISLIGDHPNDILAARANQIQAIAVATGKAGADELAVHHPDHLLSDLRSLSLEMLL